MIRNKEVNKREKKARPLIGFLLFVISILLLLITGPIGFLYGIFHNLFKSGFRGVGAYFLKIAISIDQLGNVLMQHLLNAVWIKKEGYRFGNRDETISSALGRNKRLGTLTAFGRWIDRVLDSIDPNHSLNSIDYYVEPTVDFEDQLAWIHTKDRQVLCLRQDASIYTLPCTKRVAADSDGEALYRAVKEQLGVEIDISTLVLKGIFMEQGDSTKKMLRITCYSADILGQLGSGRSLHEYSWLGFSDRDAVLAADRRIFDYLNQKGELA